LIAFLTIVMSLFVLETVWLSIGVTSFQVGNTPITKYAQVSADGSTVLIAHGFAGSQQMMQGYALPLARAGYQVYAFEFLGHGRHPDPMSGDVNALDGTTRMLMNQTAAVLDALESKNAPIALLGPHRSSCCGCGGCLSEVFQLRLSLCC
jgi:pimeloyl-ACP methyl ester carboxylesterase